MRILGIDPGSTRIGYGLIENQNGKEKLLMAGLLKISSQNKERRLVEAAKTYKSVLEKGKPDLVAIEKLYFVKNLKTGIEVAQTRGVLMMLTAENNVSILELTPAEIKMNITGRGNSDKKAVAQMSCRILGIEKIKGPDDVSDAVAAALSASQIYKFSNKKYLDN